MQPFQNNKLATPVIQRGHLQRGNIPPRGGMNGLGRDRRSGKATGHNKRDRG
jgi:hypothetical protein